MSLLVSPLEVATVKMKLTLVRIPMITVNGQQLQDWDCPDAVDWVLLKSTLDYVKKNGQLPEDSFSKEDQNEVGPNDVPDEVIEEYRRKVKTNVTICLLDGFLLYPTPDWDVPDLPLDVKLFVRTTLDRVMARRGKRSGYVTLEGFWADPPGYIEDVVWPNYERAHKWMFEGGDCNDGEVKNQVNGIEVAPGKGEKDMKDLLSWAVEVISKQVAEGGSD